jgi:hypothetical protein
MAVAAAAELPPPSPLDGADVANKRAGWKKFPMVMRHPAERPAVVSNDRQVGPDGREVWVNSPPGAPIMYGPVTVLNEHQEELHQSKGYRGHGDPAAIERHERAPTPPGYVYAEYPRLLEDGSIDEGPDAPAPPDNFYPYYVRMDGWEPERVEDREEHQALLKRRGVEEPPPVEAKLDDRDAKIALLEEQLAELRALVALAVRSQPATAPIEAPPVDLKVNTAELPPPAPITQDVLGAFVEPTAEEEIKARLAELEAENSEGKAENSDAEAEKSEDEAPAKRKR